MRRVPLALAFCVALLAPAFGQDKTFDLKLKKEARGDKVASKSSEKADIKVVIDLMGMEIKNNEKNEEEKDFTEEILEKPPGSKKATKLSRKYTVSEETKDGKTKKHVYAGKTVLVEKKGDKYKFTVDGEELAEDDAEDLEKEFNKKDEFPLENEDFLPGKPVKLGDSWAVDAEKVVKSFGEDSPMILDAKGTKLSGKLVKVYQKDGKQFGVIELTLLLAVKEMKLDGNATPMKPGSKITGTVTLDVCIDGTSHAGSEKATLKFDLSGEIPNGKIAITGNVVMLKSQEEVGK